MGLKKITFTGVDDTTTARDLREIPLHAPAGVEVEFGVLYSKKGEGRYPTAEGGQSMVAELATQYPTTLFAAHYCGAYARDFFHRTDCTLPPAYYGRLQLNINFRRTNMTVENWNIAERNIERLQSVNPGTRVIFQVNGQNRDVLAGVIHNRPRMMEWVDLLWDESGGRGVAANMDIAVVQMRRLFGNDALAMMENTEIAYAGGLGPQNIARVISQLEQLHLFGDVYSLDMESKVRDGEDNFSPDICKRVLDIAGEELARHKLEI